MKLRNTNERYGAITKLLHWSIAMLIIGLIWLGWYMVDLTYYDKWYNASLTAHRALGMLVLLLAALKIAWIVLSRPPPFVATIKPWERVAAKATHHTLYLAMLLIPVTGYIISTSEGDAIPFFDWFEIPALFSAGERLRDLAIEIHYYAAYGVAFLVLLHAGAALKHQFLDRDGTLKRML